MTRTEFPVIYARPVATVRDTLPACTGVGVVAVVVAVKNRSPAFPVAPDAPVGPIVPVEPVGPSIPSRFTLYTAEPKVP